MFLRKNKFIFFWSIWIVFSTPTFIYPKENDVNVLVWYGYFDDPPGVVKIIENKCNVKFSHDIYYTNSEILNRMSKTDKDEYDILIFSETIYKPMERYISKNGINLMNEVELYHPAIKKHYLSQHFPKNVGYFVHSLTGFLYDPNVLNIAKGESFKEIFTKANDKIIVMLDDPVEIWNLINTSEFGYGLINESKNVVPGSLNFNNFEKLMQHTDVYIANNNNQLYDSKRFAGAFIWTGSFDAYASYHPKKKFELYIDPKVSYISSDLIVAMNNKPETKCVINEIMSSEVMRYVLADTQYFTPFGRTYEIKPGMYSKIYGDITKRLYELKWLPSVSDAEYTELENNWSDIQVKISKLRSQNDIN